MSNRLFVGNLDWNTQEDELRAHFGQFGEVSHISIAVHRDTGRSRGFGFITYLTPEAAATAIENLDNTDFRGRNINVKPAETNNRERQPRNNGGFGNGGFNKGFQNRRPNYNQNDDGARYNSFRGRSSGQGERYQDEVEY